MIQHDLFRVAKKNWKKLEFDNLGLKTWNLSNLKKNRPQKTWNFEQKSLKKPGIFNIFKILSSKLSITYKKSIIQIKKIYYHQHFLLKNTFKVVLQYLFNVFFTI